jgi:hypothetical protein
VPVGAVHLAGAEQLTFDDVLHGHIGSPWYGDERVVERWWPVAVRLWREALSARAEGRRPIGPGAPAVAEALEDETAEAARESATEAALTRPAESP